MSLFLSSDALAVRRTLLADPAALDGLTASLQAELHEALDVPVPQGKSRLTRHGGRCVRCTVLLTFDPREPFAHACPQCGTVYTDRVHHEWWLMNGHLWTAEQAVRAAALAALMDDPRAARRADDVLGTYADRYLAWPNRDNALGPTRPFFSTYLESIWLLQLAAALDLREVGSASLPPIDPALAARVRSDLVAPSARLIASYDEGRSNRQAWRCAALLAAAAVLGDAGLRDGTVQALRRLIADGLHEDGSWYEGENYHLFAHRGLLTAVTLAEQSGCELPADLLRRFERGFAAPFRTMLPDGTFPARRDSQYGITLRQWRTADWLECGVARSDAPALRAALAMMYSSDAPAGATGRAVSTADAERNTPAVRLTRADTGWRALLLARPLLPTLEGAVPHSELLEGQGLAVFRRRHGALYVALDYGDPGAGHGHPDRLNLLVATAGARWLDDVGTGSYTAPSLQWYRSSLCHNAPQVHLRDQGTARGTLLAHDETPQAGWVCASFVDPDSGVRFERTVVVLDDHLLDELRWWSEALVSVDLPLQAALDPADAPRALPPVPVPTIEAPLAAFAQSRDAWQVGAGRVIALSLRGVPSPTRPVPADACAFRVQVWSDVPAQLWTADTIGPPAGAPHGLLSLRQSGTSGRSVRLIASAGSRHTLAVDHESITIAHPVHGDVTHVRTDDGWTIRSADGAVTALSGMRHPSPETAPAEEPATADGPTVPLPAGSVAQFALGETAYRPTESTWHEAGQPGAQVAIQWQREPAAALQVVVHASLGRPPHFAPPCDTNPLDNEPPDVNSDGAQLHWRGADGTWHSALAVPDGAGVRLTAATGSLDGLSATWHPDREGFQVAFTLALAPETRTLTFDCCVNECPPERERRRGQLVLSGARGESGYLRGARQDPAHAITLVLDPVLP